MPVDAPALPLTPSTDNRRSRNARYQLALPRFASADAPESVQVAEIYQLQAAFHRAKTTQDLDLMMSLWADDATFNNNGTIYAGSDQIKSFWQGSGSFTHHRFSLVPS
jgi:SnoaL-like domain